MKGDPIIIIPSREGSTRLSKKPLIDLHGKSLVQRVFELAFNITKHTYIATDSDLIESHARDFTNNIVMTSDGHISGTDRVHEAAKKLNVSSDQFIINLQGDEPFIPSILLQNIIEDYFDYLPNVITASQPLKSEDINNPNCVKVTSNKEFEATKFFRIDNNYNSQMDHHIGIYGYTFKSLNEFVNLEPTKNELLYKLEQLRFLDNGYKIHVTKYNNFIQKGIDTEEDVINARKYLEINDN